MRATRLPRHPGSRITLVAKPRISEAELRALARERHEEIRRATARRKRLAERVPPLR